MASETDHDWMGSLAIERRGWLSAPLLSFEQKFYPLTNEYFTSFTDVRFLSQLRPQHRIMAIELYGSTFGLLRFDYSSKRKKQVTSLVDIPEVRPEQLLGRQHGDYEETAV